MGVILLSYSFYGYKNRRGWVASLVIGIVLILVPLIGRGLSPSELLLTFMISLGVGTGPALIWWTIVFLVRKKPKAAMGCILTSLLLMSLIFGLGPEFLQRLMDDIESSTNVSTPEQ